MSDPFMRMADEWDREEEHRRQFDRAVEEEARKNAAKAKANGKDSSDALSLIKSSKEFVARFVPPDYLIDGLIIEAFLYSLTGATGAGKTAVTLRLAASTALGIIFANRETKKRRVLYLAAENPADVRMRWIALSQQMDFDAETIEVYFVEGVFKISQMVAKLRSEAERVGGEFGLVVIDTGPVFYEGDDENNRTQQGRHAEMLRSLIDIIPGKPAVIANVHPVKNAAPDNLLPAGGGNFLNQVDGNFTATTRPSSIGRGSFAASSSRQCTLCFEQSRIRSLRIARVGLSQLSYAITSATKPRRKLPGRK